MRPNLFRTNLSNPAACGRKRSRPDRPNRYKNAPGKGHFRIWRRGRDLLGPSLGLAPAGSPHFVRRVQIRSRRICRTLLAYGSQVFSSGSALAEIKNAPRGGISYFWRRGRDSNPRCGSTPHTHFPGEPVRPLRHLSETCTGRAAILGDGGSIINELRCEISILLAKYATFRFSGRNGVRGS